MTEKGFKVLFNNEIPRDQWEEFLSDNPYATPFQTPEFYELFSSVKYLSAVAIAIEDSGSLKALAVITLQKEPGLIGYFSRRAIIYGGPLLLERDKAFLKLLLKELSRYVRGKAIYIEARNLLDYSEFYEVFKNTGWYYEPYLNFRVNCEDEGIIWKNLNRLRKRQIKRATKNNVIINVANDIREVGELYSLLKHTYKTRIKKPLFKWEFFRLFFEKGFGKVFIIKKDCKIIGGHFCPIGNKVIYDWYGCGLDKDFKDYAPSTMAVYAALLYGANNGYKYLDFMGAGSPYEKYGVRDFKTQFGGALVEYGRFIKILNPALFQIGLIGLKIISILKKRRYK